MPTQQVSFDIDDELTVDQNIAVFRARLEPVDATLAGVLAAALADLSHDIAIDQGALLDSLFAATAPAPASGEVVAPAADGAGA